MIVGVCLERSIDHVVAVLAVLKAGGAFVILDPEAPRERTRYVLQDSGSPLVLTHESLRSRIAGLQTMVLCLHEAEEESQRRSANPLGEAPRPEQPAYLSYTSGSTGKPKGVLVERGPFSAHCRAMVATYGLGREDRVLQFSQFSADASLEQIFPTLASGARLVMRGGEIWTPEELREQLILRRVTVMNLWPTYWQQAVRVWARTPAALAGLRLRLVILGGERLGGHALAQWRVLQVETRVLERVRTDRRHHHGHTLRCRTGAGTRHDWSRASGTNGLRPRSGRAARPGRCGGRAVRGRGSAGPGIPEPAGSHR